MCKTPFLASNEKTNTTSKYCFFSSAHLSQKSKQRLGELNQLINSDLIQEKPQIESYALCRLWLQQVNQVNPAGIQELSELLEIKKEDFIKKLI